MTDEINKMKYQELNIKLKEIRNELELLKNDYNDLYGITKEGLMIDDKIVEEDNFISISNNQEQVLNELINVLIPIVTSKI